jgi:hypothetical protein
MAQTDGVFFAPWKVIGLAITASIGISGIAMTLISDRLAEHAAEIAELGVQMNKGARYTEADATRDFRYIENRIVRIESHDERHDERCRLRMDEHVKSHK